MPPPPAFRRGAALALAAAAPAVAQPVGEPPVADPPPEATAAVPAEPQPPPDPAAATGLGVSFTATAVHNFDADIDGADSVRSSAARLRVGVRRPVSKRLSLGLSASAGLRHYDFRGDSGLTAGGAAPWDTAQTWGLGANALYRADEQLLLFAGLNGSSRGEPGAEFDQTLTGGISLGFAWTFSKELTLGLGMIAQTRLEDDLFVLPFPTVRWTLPGDPQGRWRVQMGAVEGGPPAVAGAALFYTPSPAFSAFGGIGAAGIGGDFRLDDDGPAPGGVAREQSFPLILGVDWRPATTVQVSAFAGVSLVGEIELLDSEGRTLGKRDVDPAPTAGLAVTWRF